MPWGFFGVRAISLFVFLFAFWLVLSGHYNPGQAVDRYLIGCGVGVSAFVTWLSARRFAILDSEGHPIQLSLRAFWYGPWLLWQIILSNWDVFKRVWSPSLPIDPVLVRIPDETASDLGTVIYANSITLTPGTVTVSADRDRHELLVHCLHGAAGEGLMTGDMLEHVKRFEGLTPR
jgi:multicomponent Na+:H+ antiporter subunit E